MEINKVCNTCKYIEPSDSLYTPHGCDILNLAIDNPSSFYCALWEKPTEYAYNYAVQAGTGEWFMSIPITDAEFKNKGIVEDFADCKMVKLEFTKSPV